MLLYSLYRKQMASPYLVLESSACSWSNNLSTLAQDLIRRMLNVSLEVDWGERIRVINDYVKMLECLG